jgi:multidrug transporter EmrE-like cation transporter
MTYILLITSAILNGLAQILWKTGLSLSQNTTTLTEKLFALLTNLSFLGGFFLYGVSIILWIIVISKVEVSYAYPLLSLSYIVVMIGGYML